MDINLRIEELEESCNRLANKEKKDLEEKIKKDINEQITAETQEYTKKQETTYKKKCTQLEKEYYKEIYSYELEEKRRILEKIKEYKINLTEDITNEMKRILDTQIYEEYFWNLVKEILPQIDTSNLVIGLVQRDYNRFQEKLTKEYSAKCKQIDDNFIGGFTIQNENILIDSTLKNEIDEAIAKRDLR